MNIALSSQLSALSFQSSGKALSVFDLQQNQNPCRPPFIQAQKCSGGPEHWLYLMADG